ncbi:hypothetical protein RJ639_036693 [Escallonia herrerae]|uniref:Exocyst subunit Exo70 family protein n=1 Tax=Escallonia herrerae TaxID=1293975 RepID=A0AA88WT76_9ASTE|nr:hypothetical protein RJ639_036693 [Escallonia herrerae]
MITDDFLTRLMRIVQQAATSYQRGTLEKIVSCLRPEGLNANGVSKSAIRKRIKTFNSMFEEFYKTQVRWHVPDLQLRQELRLSITQKVISAYSPYPCFKNLKEFSLETLLLITYNLSEEHIIGIGIYGPVYRATLNDDRVVAIKRAKFSTSSTDAGAYGLRSSMHYKVPVIFTSEVVQEGMWDLLCLLQLRASGAYMFQQTMHSFKNLSSYPASTTVTLPGSWGFAKVAMSLY